MKVVLQILAFLALLAVIYIIVLNSNEVISIKFLASGYDAFSQVTDVGTKVFSVPFYTLMVLGAGMFSGICILVPFYLTQTEQLYAYKRELEKSSVKTDSSTSQVKVLQAKVQVLEKALKDALEK